MELFLGNIGLIRRETIPPNVIAIYGKLLSASQELAIKCPLFSPAAAWNIYDTNDVFSRRDTSEN